MTEKLLRIWLELQEHHGVLGWPTDVDAPKFLRHSSLAICRGQRTERPWFSPTRDGLASNWMASLMGKLMINHWDCGVCQFSMTHFSTFLWVDVINHLFFIYVHHVTLSNCARWSRWLPAPEEPFWCLEDLMVPTAWTAPRPLGEKVLGCERWPKLERFWNTLKWSKTQFFLCNFMCLIIWFSAFQK